MPRSARIYAACITGIGALILMHALVSLQISDLPLFLTYAALAMLVATLKVALPGLAGTITGAFVFVIAAVAQLTVSETVLIAGTSTLLQCIWKPKQRPMPIQVAFNVSVIMIAAAAAYNLSQYLLGANSANAPLAVTALAVTILFGVNSTLVAIVLCLVQSKPLSEIYRLYNVWAFPYYLVGSIIATGLITMTASLGWMLSAPAFPMLFAVYCFYQQFTQKLSQQQC